MSADSAPSAAIAPYWRHWNAYERRARDVYWNTSTPACRAKGPSRAMCLLPPEHDGPHYGNGFDAWGPKGPTWWKAARMADEPLSREPDKSGGSPTVRESGPAPALDAIELVHAHGHPFLHCMPCGATFGLHWDPLTVDTIVRCAQYHVPRCPGEIDDDPIPWLRETEPDRWTITDRD